MSSAENAYLVLSPTLTHGAVVCERALAAVGERNRVRLDLPEFAALDQPLTPAVWGVHAGVVICMNAGCPGRGHLRLVRQIIRTGKRAFLYWPREAAAEEVTRLSIGTYWRTWGALKLWSVTGDARAALRRMNRGLALASISNLCRHFVFRRQSDRPGRRFLVELWRRPRKTWAAFRAAIGIALRDGPDALDAAVYADPITNASGELDVTRIELQINKVIRQAAPLALPTTAVDGAWSVGGTGVYLRTDFWAPISSGGSYGHTCYVARHLAAGSKDFVAFMPHRYTLLDELGIRQVVMEPAASIGTEEVIIAASDHYYRLLRPAFEAMRPAYIFERLCLGNFVGARLSQELGIPYIVEYNGSEISMRRSFAGEGYKFEKQYLLAEQAAFDQASLITVVSAQVGEELEERGIDPSKILVNPNGAEPDIYRPPTDDERRAIRTELGIPPEVPVLGFTGTFGGWHGIEVLAAALPEILRRVPDAHALLIGDGNFKHLVDEAVVEHALERRVHAVGRVPQQDGCRFLQAIDVYLSPHDRNMADRPFFGSPTKVFEYMALGGAIVASDLEQIGEVLSPALRSDQLVHGPVAVRRERSILCTPGAVEDVVEASVFLAGHPEVRAALGQNARQAILDIYSWEQHVARLWEAPPYPSFPEPSNPERMAAEAYEGGDGIEAGSPAFEPRLAGAPDYKSEIHLQWDQDPCGSHYAQKQERATLEWFEETEAYRFDEYAPWMPEVMEFTGHSGERVLEVGGGMGNDLARFARGSARVIDVDFSGEHLRLARRNFSLRDLPGSFVHGDAEILPLRSGCMDFVYSNGVIHHTPNTSAVVEEIYRVLRPGGRVCVMVYAEHSLHYVRQLLFRLGIEAGMLADVSMGEIMSRSVEISERGARPLVKVYTRKRLRDLFQDFEDVRIVQRQLVPAEVPGWLGWVGADRLGRVCGWNLIVKARKPLE